MCLVDYQKVLTVAGERVILASGRVARAGKPLKIEPGDYVEVYADLVLAKADQRLVNTVISARKKGRNV